MYREQEAERQKEIKVIYLASSKEVLLTSLVSWVGRCAGWWRGGPAYLFEVGLKSRGPGK